MEMTFQFMGSIRNGIMQSLLDIILKASGLLLSVEKYIVRSTAVAFKLFHC